MLPPPPAPKRYVIGVLDLLGYKKHLWENARVKKDGGLAKLYETMFVWLTAAKLGTTFSGLTLTGDKKLLPINEAVDFVVASDTMLFWAPVEKADFLISAVARVFLRALGWGAPMRGTIAVGECILDLERHILIGYPIVEALEAEKLQNWLGVAVLSNAATTLSHVQGIVPYQVPVKEDSATCDLEYAVAWHWAEESPDAAEIYLRRLSDTASASYRAKYENTRTFLQNTPQPQAAG